MNVSLLGRHAVLDVFCRVNEFLVCFSRNVLVSINRSAICILILPTGIDIKGRGGSPKSLCTSISPYILHHFHPCMIAL